MMKFLIDTNAILYFLHDRLEEPLPKGIYLFSVVTEIELFSYPNMKLNEETSINRLLTSMIKIELNLPIQKKTIMIRRNYRLKLPDAVIAASALIYDSILISNDVNFDKVKNLRRLELTLKPYNKIT